MPGAVRPPRRYEYIADGPAIYVDSFATIRREADLSRIPADAEKLAVRMIHGTGQTDLTADLQVHPGLVGAARSALEAGAPILCDAHMVASGVTRARLPYANDVVCTLSDQRVRELATEMGTTRSAAALSLWGETQVVGGTNLREALAEAGMFQTRVLWEKLADERNWPAFLAPFGQILANLIGFVDPQRVVAIGPGLTPELCAALESELNGLLPKPVHVQLSALGTEAAARGALAGARELALGNLWENYRAR